MVTINFDDRKNQTLNSLMYLFVILDLPEMKLYRIRFLIDQKTAIVTNHTRKAYKHQRLFRSDIVVPFNNVAFPFKISFSITRFIQGKNGVQSQMVSALE